LKRTNRFSPEVTADATRGLRDEASVHQDNPLGDSPLGPSAPWSSSAPTCESPASHSASARLVGSAPPKRTNGLVMMLDQGRGSVTLLLHASVRNRGLITKVTSPSFTIIKLESGWYWTSRVLEKVRDREEMIGPFPSQIEAEKDANDTLALKEGKQ